LEALFLYALRRSSLALDRFESAVALALV